MSELLATLIGEPPLSKMNPPNTKGGSFVSQLGSFAKTMILPLCGRIIVLYEEI